MICLSGIGAVWVTRLVSFLQLHHAACPLTWTVLAFCHLLILLIPLITTTSLLS
uniref:Uncharacterized protein n=1 Tax=Anguilla anguilla TaxID=7936 RepID=A0A0E9SBU4_ANGAN